MSGSFVSPELRARVRGFATPIAAGFGRLGLTPNHLTLIGFAIALAAASSAATQSWILAAILLIVGGSFDLLDGALARATGTTSALGAFFDSVFDRWGEGVVYAGIAVAAFDAGFGAGVLLAPLAMTSAFMVSYTRAKSESLGFTEGTGMAAVGIAPREVRIVILTVGLLLTGILGGIAYVESGTLISIDYWHGGRPVLAAALALITILATITTIQRIVHVIRQAGREAS